MPTDAPPSGFSPIESLCVFLLPVFLGLGVPVRLTGLSSDFLGLPRPFFAGAGDGSWASLSGTMVVVVRWVTFLVGGAGSWCGVSFSSSLSASTVTRIRHGLIRFSAFAVVLVGDDVPERYAGGVSR